MRKKTLKKTTFAVAAIIVFLVICWALIRSFGGPVFPL